jgi:hypothetical protein
MMPGVIEQEVRSKTVRTTPPFYHLYALSLGSRWGITCFDGFSSSAIPERGFVKRAGTIFIVSAPIVLTPDRSSKLSVRSQKEVGHSQIFLFLKALGPDKYIYMCGVSLMWLAGFHTWISFVTTSCHEFNVSGGLFFYIK